MATLARTKTAATWVEDNNEGRWRRRAGLRTTAAATWAEDDGGGDLGRTAALVLERSGEHNALPRALKKSGREVLRPTYPSETSCPPASRISFPRGRDGLGRAGRNMVSDLRRESSVEGTVVGEGVSGGGRGGGGIGGGGSGSGIRVQCGWGWAAACIGGASVGRRPWGWVAARLGGGVDGGCRGDGWVMKGMVAAEPGGAARMGLSRQLR